jgi:hypothetical protein
MKRSESIGKLATAKAQAQGKIQPIGKDKTARVQLTKGGSYAYSYADLASCLEAVNGPLAEAGIALFQPVSVGDGNVVATTLLVHGESGEWISEDYAAPIVDSGDARSVGSAATYARRYGLLSLLAIAPSEEDDDAEAARGDDRPMQRQRSAPAPRQAAREVRQAPDEPVQTEAEKARAFVAQARDKAIFDDAVSTGLSREGFHAWVEKILTRPYSSNADWTEDDRQHLEDEIASRREAVELMNKRETIANSPRLNGSGKRPAPVTP